MKVNIQIEGFDDLLVLDAKRVLVYEASGQPIDLMFGAAGVTKRSQVVTTERLISKADVAEGEKLV